MKRRLYLAAPLFSVAERKFNADLKAQLSARFDVFLHQENVGLFTEVIAKGEPVEVAQRTIFEKDLAGIRDADVFLIVLDGRTIDEGATFELGFAYALGKICLGLQTDSRRLLPSGNNPMIECAVSQVFTTMDALIEYVNHLN